MCHNFQYFAEHIDIFWKYFILPQLFHLLGIDTDPDRPDPDCQALYAAPDQDPAMRIRPDPIPDPDPQHWYKIFDYNS
jgi:hypothetical protein